VSERERHMLVTHVLKCVKDVQRVRWNLVSIRVKRSRGFLFVGVVIAFVDNSWLINNSRKLVYNIRNKF